MDAKELTEHLRVYMAGTCIQLFLPSLSVFICTNYLLYSALLLLAWCGEKHLHPNTRTLFHKDLVFFPIFSHKCRESGTCFPALHNEDFCDLKRLWLKKPKQHDYIPSQHSVALQALRNCISVVGFSTSVFLQSNFTIKMSCITKNVYPHA